MRVFFHETFGWGYTKFALEAEALISVDILILALMQESFDASLCAPYDQPKAARAHASVS